MLIAVFYPITLSPKFSLTLSLKFSLTLSLKFSLTLSITLHSLHSGVENGARRNSSRNKRYPVANNHNSLWNTISSRRKRRRVSLLYGENNKRTIPSIQSETDLSSSAIKTLAATSFARRMKATHMKKPLLFGNLQNNHILAAKSTVNSLKYV